MFDMIPFRNNDLLREEKINKMMKNFFGDDFFKNGLSDSFNVDVKENEKEYIIDADLPGYNKEAIELGFKDNYLTISAKKENKIEEKQENYIRQERSYGNVSRTFYFDNVEEEKISAEFNNGVLKVILPKSTEQKPQGKNIEIK